MKEEEKKNDEILDKNFRVLYMFLLIFSGSISLLFFHRFNNINIIII